MTVYAQDLMAADTLERRHRSDRRHWPAPGPHSADNKHQPGEEPNTQSYGRCSFVGLPTTADGLQSAARPPEESTRDARSLRA